MKTHDNRLFKFIIVGIINTIVGTAIMFGLYNLAGCSYWLSSAANYIFASILSYVLNRKYTFRYSGKTVGSFVRFAANIAVCYIIAYGAAKPFISYLFEDASVRLQENTAMLTGMVIFTVLNYTGQRFFVFGDSGK
ncbi:MAG: GtrA family protein [Anaerovoracaceae bacterium]